ncbi:MAG: hypothetical protein GY869_28865, partial [Planctomycetes bacterium]|nr:hypothetical protein [Planctomycetota bacterium]
GEFELDASAHTIKFWLYNDTGEEINSASAIEDIYLKCEYVDSYGDATTEYTKATVNSTQDTIADAADADDWDYLEVSFTTAIASKVRVSLMINYYKAAGTILIDPEPVVT